VLRNETPVAKHGNHKSGKCEYPPNVRFYDPEGRYIGSIAFGNTAGTATGLSAITAAGTDNALLLEYLRDFLQHVVALSFHQDHECQDIAAGIISSGAGSWLFPKVPAEYLGRMRLDSSSSYRRAAPKRPPRGNPQR
jgi:hypothetical protein